MYNEVQESTGRIVRSSSSRARLRVAAITLTALVGLTLGGCAATTSTPTTAPSAGTGDPLAALAVKAKAETDTLVWYTSTVDAANQALAADFEKKYGIKVEFTRLATTDLVNRFTQEKTAGATTADVFEPSSPQIFSDQPTWFSSIKKVPGYAAFPAAFKSDKAIQVSLSPFNIAYNTDLVKASDAPKTWKDLTDPKWKGKVLLTDPQSSPTWTWWASLMKKTYGDKFLKALAANDPQIAPSGSAGAASLAAGAKSILFPVTAGNSADLIAQGAPIGNVQVEKQTSGSAIYLGMVTGSPHPLASQLFIAYRMTKAASTITCQTAQSAVPITDPACPLPSGWSAPDFINSAKDLPAILTDLRLK